MILVSSFFLGVLAGYLSVAARVGLATGFAGLVAAIAVVTYARGRRPLALGLALGYGLLTLVSAGACTLLFPSDAAQGGLLYLVALILSGLGLLVMTLVTAIRRKA